MMRAAAGVTPLHQPALTLRIPIRWRKASVHLVVRSQGSTLQDRCVGEASLRLATKSDVPRITEIVQNAYAGYLDRLDRPPAPMLRDYSSDVDRGLVWVTGDPIHGLIALVTVEDGLLIENVAVDPTVQGQGIGRRLLAFAEDEARRRGVQRLSLYTNAAMAENVAIYSHLGYREVRRATEDGYHRVYMDRVLPSSPP
jgi:GNAT superfamily N-acetyltransferase